MEQEEKKLEQLYGKKNPFIVPEGYFEDFASTMMEQIPQKETGTVRLRPTVWMRIRPVVLGAASIFAVIFSVSVYLSNHVLTGQQAQTTINADQANPSSYNDVDLAVDYAMIDNEDIYSYVSEN